MVFSIDQNSSMMLILSQIDTHLQSFVPTKSDNMLLLTICSELVNNIYHHADSGSLMISVEKQNVTLIAKDHGAGYKDINLIIKEGYSTKNSLGIGLPGIIRMSDDFEATSNKKGVEIRISKKMS